MSAELHALRLLLIITDTDVDKKIDRLFEQESLPVYHQCRAKGTARTELLDICGLSGSTRLLTVTILPRGVVGKIFDRLEDELYIWKRGKGIAVTIPITGMQTSMNRLIKEEVYDKQVQEEKGEERPMKKDASYAMILAAVKEGYSDRALDASTKAGARGGSIIRGRRRGNEALVKFMGISMQEEQEILLIIAPMDKKIAIMNAINESCGIHTPAQGTLISVPVEDMIGMAVQ